MNSISRLLAWRYLINKTNKHAVSTMILICFFATLAGSFSLTLVVSVMSGFEKTTHQKLQGIHAPIIMESPGNELNMQKIASILSTDFADIIKYYAPSTCKQALVSGNNKSHYYPITIKGINPKKELLVSSIGKSMLAIDTSHASLPLQNNQILLGSKLAKILNVSVGDTLIIMCPDAEQQSVSRIDLHEEHAIVGGIFETGIEEFDQALAYCSLEFMQTLFCDVGVTTIGVRLKKGVPETSSILALSKRFGLRVYSWKELYPALISALKLEKYAMFFILLLISLVASMNLISLMCMYIQHKKKDIALLYLCGMRKHDIQSIFIMIGMGISCIASLVGIILALVAGYYIDSFKVIALPDSYYVSHVPIAFEPYLIVIIFIASIIIGFCASYFSSRNLLQQQPITILSK